MPVIELVLNEVDHYRLKRQHDEVVAAWPGSGHVALPPTFAVWLGTQLMQPTPMENASESWDDVCLFDVIEKLVTSLAVHGFQLAHTAEPEISPANSALSLSQSIVERFQLQPQYTRRLQELFVHYLKTPREIADAAHVGVTNRAYGALTQAQQRLTEQTSTAIERLGSDRAIGRVEGATAMLVSLEVMDAATANRLTSAFKVQAHTPKKFGWVGKIFGES